jgi:fibronectin type 3 domain-containing protein
MRKNEMLDMKKRLDHSPIMISLLIAILLLLSIFTFIPSEAEGAPGSFERTTLIIDPWGNVGTSSSLALDSNGKVHISYIDVGSAGNDIKYASNSRGSWYNMGIDWWDMGYTSSIAVDSNDKVHIAYQDINSLDLKYATDAGGSWATYVLDDTSIGWYCSIAVDSNDKVHIGYWDFGNLTLKYATNAGGSWAYETVEGGNVGYYPSIAIDSNNSVHISHYDNNNHDLRYATNEGGSWTRQAIDTAGNVGITNSLGIDSDGNLHISYYDSTNGNLKYVNNEGGGWNFQTIDHEGDVGLFSSLAIDPSDGIHISYYDDTNGDLKYTTDLGGTWGCQALDTEGDVGLYTAIAVDSQYRAHISYYDYLYEDLKYTTGFFTVPSAPSNLQTVAGDGFANISWDAPSIDGGYPIDSYNIYRGDSPGTETLLTTVGDRGYFNDTSLVNGQTYYYRVSAVNVAEESPLSEEVSAKPATIPGVPMDLHADSCGFQVNLSWNPPSFDGGSSITGYNVYRGENSDWMLLLTEAVDATYYNDTWVVKGNEYFYRVTAVNDMGQGPMSDVVSATPMSAPSQPDDLQAVAKNASVELSWSPPMDSGGSTITNYTIYRGTAQDEHSLLVTIGDELAYLDSNLINGQTYYYRVSATNWVGEGPMSAEVEAKPLGVPSAPEGLAASARDGQVNLSWSYPADDGGTPITNFTIYRGNSSSSLLPLVTIGDALQYDDTSVLNGITYYYEVSAVNAVGEGERSAQVNATPVADLIPTVPSSPQDLEAVAGDAWIALEWSAPEDDGGADITNYKVYRGDSPSSLVLLTTIENSLQYNDTSVLNGETYYYQVGAINSVGIGPKSASIYATPSSPFVPSVPSQPQNLQADAGDGFINISWEAPLDDGGSPITGYVIYRGNSSDSLHYLDEVGPSATSFIDTSVQNDHQYYYCVFAMNGVGEGNLSVAVSGTPLYSTSDGDDLTLPIAVAIIGVLAIASIAIYMRRIR